ncbi:MAG: hypothetical protein AAFY15_15035 [Cyanobacteria bacterium J06648_11]
MREKGDRPTLEIAIARPTRSMGISSPNAARSTSAALATDSSGNAAALPSARALSDRLIWQSRYRRHRVARYALWRTRFRGPDPSQIGAIHATGKTELCNSCRFFANTPQVVCGVHPSGPSHPICPDWDRTEPLYSKEY